MYMQLQTIHYNVFINNMTNMTKENIYFNMFEIHYHYKYKQIIIHTLSIQCNEKKVLQKLFCIFEQSQNGWVFFTEFNHRVSNQEKEVELLVANYCYICIK